MKHPLIAISLLLGACAHAPAGVDQVKWQADRNDCIWIANRETAGQGSGVAAAGAGILAAGAGIVGGAIGGAAVGSTAPAEAQAQVRNFYACMEARGYPNYSE